MFSFEWTPGTVRHRTHCPRIPGSGGSILERHLQMYNDWASFKYSVANPSQIAQSKHFNKISKMPMKRQNSSTIEENTIVHEGRWVIPSIENARVPVAVICLSS